MTDFPTLSYTSSSEIPYNPFVYLKPEEGTPFGWNLPIQVIIGSAHHPPRERLKQIKQHIELAIQTSLMTLHYMSDLLPVFSYNFVHRDIGGWQQSSIITSLHIIHRSLLGFFPITLERNVWIHGRQISHLVYNFYSSSWRRSWDSSEGVMNGPLKFLTAHKILPLLDLLAKFKWVLACSCSPNFCSCLHARSLVRIARNL